MEISKKEAAKRQLNFAIEAFFRGSDPIVVHTLAGAAGIIFHDLVEHQCTGTAWENHLAEDSKISLSQCLAVFRKAQNFFKHAEREPNGTLDFDVNDTIHLIYFVSHNWCKLNSEEEKLSIEASVFQLWYHAVWKDKFDSEPHKIDTLVEKLFAGIEGLSREEQLKKGLQVLESWRDQTQC